MMINKVYQEKQVEHGLFRAFKIKIWIYKFLIDNDMSLLDYVEDCNWMQKSYLSYTVVHIPYYPSFAGSSIKRIIWLVK